MEQLRWARIEVPEGEGLKEHGHAFWRDGEEKRTVKVVVERKPGGGYVAKVVAGIKGLLGECFYRGTACSGKCRWC